MNREPFLPNTSMQYLENLHRAEKDATVRTSLQAYMMKKEGQRPIEIARRLRMPRTTINDWIRKARERGIRARFNIKKPGAKTKLDKEQLSRLRRDIRKGPAKCGFDSGIWTLLMITEYIARRFGVHYNPSSVGFLVHRLGFSYKTPRPRHRKAASREEQEVFKKKARRMVLRYLSMGFCILCMDEMHLRLRSNPGKGWFTRGFRPTTILNNTRARVTVFGAIGVDPAGAPVEVHEFYDRGDMENMLDFMRSLHKKFGRMVVFMDNVSYHSKGKLEKLSRELDGEIVFRFFPPYTPELSPIEMFWREIRRHTRNTYFASVEKFISAVDSAIRNRAIRPTRMFDYFMPPT